MNTEIMLLTNINQILFIQILKYFHITYFYPRNKAGDNKDNDEVQQYLNKLMHKAVLLF